MAKVKLTPPPINENIIEDGKGTQTFFRWLIDLQKNTEFGISDIATNKTNIATNKINISTNTTNIATNTTNIATNTTNIATKLSKNGDTMLGFFDVFDLNPIIKLKQEAGSTFSEYSFLDIGLIKRGSVIFNNSSGNIELKRFSSTGAHETTLLLTVDGNVQISGIIPNNIADLTRKDYVDGLVSSLNARIDALTTRVTNLENAGYITDAPNDGQKYARQSASWVVIP